MNHLISLDTLGNYVQPVEDRLLDLGRWVGALDMVWKACIFIAGIVALFGFAAGCGEAKEQRTAIIQSIEDQRVEMAIGTPTVHRLGTFSQLFPASNEAGGYDLALFYVDEKGALESVALPAGTKGDTYVVGDFTSAQEGEEVWLLTQTQYGQPAFIVGFDEKLVMGHKAVLPAFQQDESYWTVERDLIDVYETRSRRFGFSAIMVAIAMIIFFGSAVYAEAHDIVPTPGY